MNQRCVLAQRLSQSERGGQLCVIAFDEIERLLRGRFVDGRNRGDHVTDVAHLVAGEKLFVLDAETEALRRHVVGGENRGDAIQRSRAAHIEATNLRVG